MKVMPRSVAYPDNHLKPCTIYNQAHMQIINSIGTILDTAGLRQLFRIRVLLILVVIAGTQTLEAVATELSGANSSETNLSRDEVAHLKRGKVLLQTLDDERPGVAARVTALFQGDAEAVWDIIGYCKYEFVYMRGLKLCEMLEGNQFQMTMRHRIRNSWYTPTMDFTFEAKREPGGDGQALLVSGDLKVLEGRWKLMPFTDGHSLIVVHEVRIQPKMPAPEWLVRRSLSRDLPDMLACIRGLAGASISKSHIRDDLNRCPGDISGLSK